MSQNTNKRKPCTVSHAYTRSIPLSDVDALMQVHKGNPLQDCTQIRELYGKRFLDYNLEFINTNSMRHFYGNQRVTAQGYEYLISQGALVAPDVGMAYSLESRHDTVWYLVTATLPDGMVQLVDAYGKVSKRRRSFVYEFGYKYDEIVTWEDFDMVDPATYECPDCGGDVREGDHQIRLGVDDFKCVVSDPYDGYDDYLDAVEEQRYGWMS